MGQSDARGIGVETRRGAQRALVRPEKNNPTRGLSACRVGGKCTINISPPTHSVKGLTQERFGVRGQGTEWAPRRGVPPPSGGQRPENGLYITKPASVCKVCREKGSRGGLEEAGSRQLAACRRHGGTERKELSAKRRAQRPAGSGRLAGGEGECGIGEPANRGNGETGTWRAGSREPRGQLGETGRRRLRELGDCFECRANLSIHAAAL